MMARHAALARELGAQLGLPEAVLDALAGVVRAMGWTRLAGRPVRRSDPDRVACRPARRVRRGRPPRRWYRCARRARSAATGDPVRPGRSSTPCASTRPRCSARSTTPDRGMPSSTAEPSLAIALDDDSSATTRCLAISRFVDLKSPFTLGPLDRRRRARGGRRPTARSSRR